MEKWIYLETLKLCLIYILTQKYIVCVQYVISTQYKSVWHIGLRLVGLNNYFYVFSSMKQSDPENSLKAQFVIFRCQKYVKKGYMEMGKWIYLGPLKNAPGRSIFHYFNCLWKLFVCIGWSDAM